MNVRTCTLILITGILSLTAAICRGGGLTSLETGYTIVKVRTALNTDGQTHIIASTYEGTVLALTSEGTLQWHNALSGYMNHDLWCADLTGDGADEVLAANADGNVYCLSSSGRLLWQYKPANTPMYTVCAVHQGTTPYVVCGGYDKNIYYLDATGQWLKTIASSTYSREKPWGSNAPPSYCHTANFLRPVRRADGSEFLLLHGTNNAMQVAGTLYSFEVLADLPFSKIPAKFNVRVGDLRSAAFPGTAAQKVLFGTTGMIDSACIVEYDPADQSQTQLDISALRGKVDGFGYRVAQSQLIPQADSYQYFILFGSRIILVPPDRNITQSEILTCKYAFNDMCYDSRNHRMILASCQSGGSCVHLIDLKNSAWKSAWQNLSPPGKISAILANTQTIRSQLQNFTRPDWEQPSPKVWLLSEGTKGLESLVDEINRKYGNPIFLNYYWINHVQDPADWNRDAMPNDKYRTRRDSRKKYDYSSSQIINLLRPQYDNEPGIAYWGGHGNDPYYYSRATTEAVIAAANGKKTVLIYPELEDHSDDFAFVLNDLIYPLAQYGQTRNLNISVRSKHIFWQGIAHMPLWSRLMSGEFADVFVPSMEETSDKSMELSLAGRLGTWASGAVNNWGTRCARDNASFDRLRQFSHQTLPNHFLRMLIYHLASGATYLNNFSVDQQYISLYWELIARGALYIPKPSEIVSFSPVHLSMMPNPDEHYLLEGTSVKWTTFYDRDFDENNPFVFSRINGTWPGAPVTQWDFSRYAAGVKDRRLHFLPPYKYGLVLITPIQNGPFAASNPPRGKLTDHLNPIYRNIMTEYLTDGRYYYSADGNHRYNADEYYHQIDADIKKSARLLPLTVSGDVAWVTAQTAPDHLRLTLIDSGYINPNDRTAVISFHTVTPVKITDILSGETFDLSDLSAVKIPIPCGAFRFLDIDLSCNPPEKDIVKDGIVDLLDLSAIINRWLETYCCRTNHCGGCDLDASGTVDNGDIAVLTRSWNEPILPSVITSDLIPLDDAYKQNTSYYNLSQLKVAFDNRRTFLKFMVDWIPAGYTVVDATLRLTEYGDNGTGTLRFYRGSDTNWTERTLTAANEPAPLEQIAVRTGDVNTSQSITVDLSSLIQSNGLYTLVMTMDPGGNDIWFASSEVPDYQPILTITAMRTS